MTITRDPVDGGETLNGAGEAQFPAASPASARKGRRGLRAIGAVGAAIALATTVAVLSLAWIAGSLSAQTCVAKAEAKYPAVPVSAYFGKDTGPTKVSFAQQRQQAVDQCSAF